MNKKQILTRVSMAYGAFWQDIFVNGKKLDTTFFVLNSSYEQDLTYALCSESGQKIEVVTIGTSEYFPSMFTIVEMPIERLRLDVDVIVKTLTEAIYCCEEFLKDAKES